MRQRQFIHALTMSVCAVLAASASAVAQEAVKIGLILPMTGPFTTTGKQVEAGVRFYMQQNGATVAGKKIEVDLAGRRRGRGQQPADCAGTAGA